MSRGKAKQEPIRARSIYIGGPIIIDVGPDDFLDLVTEKSLPVILFIGQKGFISKKQIYFYFAGDTSYTYFTNSDEPLDDIPVKIITEKIQSEQWLTVYLERVKSERRD